MRERGEALLRDTMRQAGAVQVLQRDSLWSKSKNLINTKQAKQEAENARVAIRNIRRDANSDFKDLEKEKEISEDEQRRAEDRIQKLTDKYIAEVEAVLQVKEQDLLSF